jgi:4'-phosphopantetheinyl transferase
MIYICRNFTVGCSEDFCKRLPERRAKRAERYVREKDKFLCGLSYGLFRYGMEQSYQKSYDKDWETDRWGKPYLEDCPQIAFNISHCEDCVVCGFSDRSIGVDVQDYNSMTWDVVDFLWNAEDKMHLLNDKNWKKSLCMLWCIKESYVKCIGTGMGDEAFEKGFKDLKRENIGEGHFTYYGYYFSVFDMGTHCVVICANEFIEKKHIQEVRLYHDRTGKWDFLADWAGREKKG